MARTMVRVRVAVLGLGLRFRGGGALSLGIGKELGLGVLDKDGHVTRVYKPNSTRLKLLQNHQRVTLLLSTCLHNPTTSMGLQCNVMICVGTVIFKAKVQDNDTGIDGTLTYSMLNSSLNDKFYLDAIDGRLILKSSLDREQQDRYNITIKVHDGTAKNSNVTVYINVVDVNDNAPICTSTLYSLEIPESKRLIT